MSLVSIPQYDSTRLTERDGHAVVVGAGMAGLLAARVLADAFDEVTVLERDPAPDTPSPAVEFPKVVTCMSC